MAIGVYFHPESMTNEQYDDAFGRVEAAGLGEPRGRLHHLVFGSGDDVRIFDIWESRAAFDEFERALLPIVKELGLDLGPASVDPVHNMVSA